MLFEGLYHPLYMTPDGMRGKGRGGEGREALDTSRKSSISIGFLERNSLETTKELGRTTLTRTENRRIERYDRNFWLFFRDS